jgi:hypothetical protein
MRTIEPRIRWYVIVFGLILRRAIGIKGRGVDVAERSEPVGLFRLAFIRLFAALFCFLSGHVRVL